MARFVIARLGGRQWWMITLALIVAAAVVLALAAGRADSDDGAAGDANTAGETAPSSMPESTPADTGVSAPSDPPAQACDSDDLKGPSKPSGDAVEVSTEQNLADVVRARSGQTTYWLAPGVHRLGRDKYDQVQPHRGDTFIGAPRLVRRFVATVACTDSVSLGW